MNPTVYLYRERQGQFELYLGGFSTFNGLQAIDEKLKIQVVNIGASNYEKYGWATEREFPIWKTVGDVKSFLAKEGEFGLIHFEIKLHKYGSLSTHDDAECNFKFKKKSDLIKVVSVVSESIHQELLIAGLLNNPEMYIEIGKSGTLNKFHSFDHYLKETNNS